MKKEKVCEFYPEIRECSYDPSKQARFRYFLIDNCSHSMYQVLLERGWRRFGKYFFVPVCPECDDCITIRYLIDAFSMSKNLKRVHNQNKDLQVVLKRPSINYERLELYNKYHVHMNKKKGWDYTPIKPRLYNEMFVEGFESFGYEIEYRYEEKLIGVAMVDILPKSLSAVYLFYDHDFEKRSLGVYSLLKQFEIAKELGISYLYPGYWIKDHHSMGYKERFKPFEILTNAPDLDEVSRWAHYE